MADFAELCADVISVTNRPDLVAETKLAVKAATLKLHQSDFYFRDLFETGIQYDNSDYVQQFEPKAVIPLFRSLKYIRRYDSTGSGRAAEFYTVLSPTDMLDSYKQERTNVAYMAGSSLTLKSAVPVQNVLFGCYLNPDITEAGYSSWIAQDHPFAIVYEAARLVFKQIGFDEQSSAFEKLATEQLTELRMANIQAVGY